MATKSDASQNDHSDASAYLMDCTLDEYVAVCAAVANTLGFRMEEHEIARGAVLLKGRLSGKPSSVVAPVPSLRLAAGRLNSIIRAESRNRKSVILLSPFREEESVLRNGSLTLKKTGSEFLAKAVRTSAFRRLRYRIETGNEAPRPKGERKYNDLVKYARERYDAGDYAEALNTVAAVLNAHPLSDEAFRLEGHVHFKKGEYDQAIQSFDAAVKLNPASVDNWFGRATTLYMLGRYDDELECYEAILRLRPSHRGALQNKGATLQHMGRLKEAIAAYDRLLKLSRGDIGVMKNLAIAEYEVGDTDGALQTLDRILAAEKDEPSALRMKGLILAELGSPDAVKFLIRYTSLKKEDDVLDLIDSLQRQSRLRALTSESLVEPFEIGEEAQPQLPEPMAEVPSAPEPEKAEEEIGPALPSIEQKLESAGLLSDAKGMAEAVKLLESISTPEAGMASSHIWRKLESLPEAESDTAILSMRERHLFQKCDYEGAVKLAERLYSATQSDSDRQKLAADLAFSGRFEESLAHLKSSEGLFSAAATSSLLLMMMKPGKALKAIRQMKYPDLVSLNNKGMAIMEKKGPGDASDYFGVLKRKGGAEINNEAVCLMLEGDVAGATRLLGEFQGERSWQLMFNHGTVLMAEHRFEEAARALVQSVELRDTGIARNALGIAYAGLENFDAAKREFRAALRTIPPYPLAGRNLKKLLRRSPDP